MEVPATTDNTVRDGIPYEAMSCLAKAHGPDRLSATAVRCDGDTYVLCPTYPEDAKPEDVDSVTVRCNPDDGLMALVDNDGDINWSRVLWRGWWVARGSVRAITPRLSPAQYARQLRSARPPRAPQPAPRPPRPPAPSYDQTPAPDNTPDLSEYTGPRCYAPGGTTWKPC